MHLVAAALDPTTKIMGDVWCNIRDKAFRCIEYLGTQIIDEKLAAKFGVEGSVPTTPNQTYEESDTGEGACKDDVGAAGVKKGIRAEVLKLSDDDDVSRWNFFLLVFSNAPPPRALIPSLPTGSLVWHIFRREPNFQP